MWLLDARNDEDIEDLYLTFSTLLVEEEIQLYHEQELIAGLVLYFMYGHVPFMFVYVCL